MREKNKNNNRWFDTGRGVFPSLSPIKCIWLPCHLSSERLRQTWVYFEGLAELFKGFKSNWIYNESLVLIRREKNPNPNPNPNPKRYTLTLTLTLSFTP